jgi:hypothetical protein
MANEHPVDVPRVDTNVVGEFPHTSDITHLRKPCQLDLGDFCTDPRNPIPPHHTPQTMRQQRRHAPRARERRQQTTTSTQPGDIHSASHRAPRTPQRPNLSMNRRTQVTQTRIVAFTIASPAQLLSVRNHSADTNTKPGLFRILDGASDTRKISGAQHANLRSFPRRANPGVEPGKSKSFRGMIRKLKPVGWGPPIR